MSVAIEQRRCLRHPSREAVARCPECARFFCRECTAEHEDRVLCADCIAKLARSKKKRGSSLIAIFHLALALFGIATSWLFFDLVGRALARAPASFHEGTVWESLLPEK